MAFQLSGRILSGETETQVILPAGNSFIDCISNISGFLNNFADSRGISLSMSESGISEGINNELF